MTSIITAEDIKAAIREFARREWFKGISFLDDYPICSKPCSEKDKAMISAFIQKHRAGAAQREARAQRRREKARDSALKLPTDDRIALIELLIDSLISKPHPELDLTDAQESATNKMSVVLA